MGSSRRVLAGLVSILLIAACGSPSSLRHDTDGGVGVCGDSHLDPGEACDDGNTIGGDGCGADCQSDESCGNQVIDVGETCDDGNSRGGDGCSADCTSDETCGNSVLDLAKGETCDDGNLIGGDGCSANCQSNEACGNFVVDAAKGEQCDTGAVATATCDPNCTLPVCHDGIINQAAGEDCEDANTSNNDACLNTCKANRCGDGFVNPATEQCDDGNTNDSDSCRNNCTPNCTREICGDGIDQDCDSVDPSCPSNDYPGGEIDISGGATVTVDLWAAHDDNPNDGCGQPGGRDVFYTFTLPSDQVVYVDTFGSNYDSMVKIFSGSCPGLGGRELCSDDACSTVQTQAAVALAAGTYCLVVDQFSGSNAGGATTLRFSPGGRTGDEIALGAGTVPSDTGGSSDQMAPSCTGSAGAGDNGYYFLTCPGAALTVDADICDADYDAVLYLRGLPDFSTDLACDDDTCGPGSRIPSTGINDAGLWWLVVDGTDTNTGTCTLTYSVQ